MSFPRDIVRNYFWGKCRVGRSKLKKIFRYALADRQTVELCPGLRIQLDLSKSNQEFIFWFYEEVEAPLQWAIRHLLPVNGTFVDCGANIGLLGLLAIHHRKARSIFIEPLPRLAQSIRDNLSLNRFNERGVVVECAASDADGNGRLHIHPENDGSHSLHGNSRNICEVPLRRLDDILQEHGIGKVDFLKVDTEGNDFQTLLGLGELLRPERVTLIYAELADDHIQGLLSGRGYVPFRSEKLYIDELWKKQAREKRGQVTPYFHPLEKAAGGDLLWVPAGSEWETKLAIQ